MHPAGLDCTKTPSSEGVFFALPRMDDQGSSCHRGAMVLQMYWAVSLVAEGGQQVQDVEAAVRALEESVRRIQRPTVSTRLEARTLEDYAARLTARMREDGQRVLSEGRAWSTTVGPIHMHLSPR